MGVEAFRCNTSISSKLNGHCSASATHGQKPQHKVDSVTKLSGSTHTAANGTASSQAQALPSHSHDRIQKGTEKDTEPTFAVPAHAASYVATGSAVNGTEEATTSGNGNSTVSTGAGNELVASTSGAESHCGAVLSLAICGDYVCSSGSDAMIKVWKAGSLEFVR